MINAISHLSWAVWDAKRANGDRDVWELIDATERGEHGGFAQRIVAAWHRADGRNQKRLYDAFPEIFDR